MSPTPTDVVSLAGNSQQTTNLPLLLSVKEEPPLSAAEAAPLGEDTSSVSPHGAFSPRPGSAEPAGRQSLPPPISTAAATTGQQHERSGDNLPSGISVQELKKATALRMANQQQAHLRVASSFNYGRPARVYTMCYIED